LGSVRDTMKTKSAMIASAGFQTLTYFSCDFTSKERTLYLGICSPN